MKIVLSAHFDIAKPVPFITLEDKKLKGLIDNFAGVLVAWEAHKKTGIPLYLTNFEETGFKGARELVRRGELFRASDQHEPLVIVVDTTRDAGKFPAYIGNVYNFDVKPLQKKFRKDIFFMPGFFEETEDETWVYGHEKGLPTFYFGVPIAREKDYHATDNNISERAIDQATQSLVDVITWLKTTRS